MSGAVGVSEAPVYGVALVEEAVEGAESNVFGAASVFGAEGECLAICAGICVDRPNPFFQRRLVRTEFGDGAGGESAMEDFVIGINLFEVEILGAEFAGQDDWAIEDRGELGIVGNPLQMQAHR